MPWASSSAFRTISALALLTLGACAAPTNKAPQFVTDSSFTTNGVPSTRAKSVDLCIDGTTSMEGFAKDPSSAYLKLLYGLEGVVQNGLNARVDGFYKFGKRIRKISREEFRKIADPSFYRERGIFEQTRIELVFDLLRSTAEESGVPAPKSQGSRMLKQGNGADIVIVATDLFEQDSDTNLVVETIKNRCLTKGCSVGLIPVPSQFDGMVYDTKSGDYRYRSTDGKPNTYRPFYLLFFGDQDKIIDLVHVLAAEHYVDQIKLLLVGPKVVSRFSAEVRKAPGRAAAGLNPRASTGPPNEFAFNLRKDAVGGELLASFKVDSCQACPSLDPSNVEVRGLAATSKDAWQPSEDLKVDSVQADKNGIHADLSLKVAPSSGDHSYEIELRAGRVRPFRVPSWVAEFSSDNPTAKVDSQKTLNLKMLVQGLLDADAAVNRPVLAKAYLKIHNFR